MVYGFLVFVDFLNSIPALWQKHPFGNVNLTPKNGPIDRFGILAPDNIDRQFFTNNTQSKISACK
jgi:hypothetical protein